MDRHKQINQFTTVGPQPTAEEIDQLAQQGFKTVINFRTEGEEDQPLSPDAEREAVQSAGMNYAHVPVSVKSLNAESVDNFRARAQQLPKPVFAHCKSGKRAGAMMMMQMACELEMTGEQTLTKAEEMGFDCDQPELVEFVTSYVDNHVLV